jgi:hypothetical protein
MILTAVMIQALIGLLLTVAGKYYISFCSNRQVIAIQLVLMMLDIYIRKNGQVILAEFGIKC